MSTNSASNVSELEETNLKIVISNCRFDNDDDVDAGTCHVFILYLLN